MDEQEAPAGRRRLTRAEAKEQTRERLLAAAARVFARKGFAGASVEEIAQVAGYSIGAVYSNFSGKEQLFLDLLSTRRSRGMARRMAAVADILGPTLADTGGADTDAAESADGGDGSDGGDDLERAFEALNRLFLRAGDRDSEFAPLQAEFWLYAVRNPEAMDVIAARSNEQAEALEPLIAGAMARYGAAPGVSPRAVTSVLMALFTGLVRQRRIDRDSVPDDLFAQALRWLFEGLKSTRPGAAPRPEPDRQEDQP